MIELVMDNIVTIVGTVLTACFVAYLAYRNGVKVRQASAASNFRTAIDSSCTIGLYNSFQVDAFRAAFAVHKEAARIFKGHLFGRSKRRFNKAWNEYEEWSKKIFTEGVHKQDGVYSLILAHEERNIKTELSEHLNNLLKFSEQV